MKHALALSLTLGLALPAAAQDTGGDPVDEGFSLMQEGARLLFRGLMDEMQPAIDDFTGMAEEIAPALQMLADEMGPALIALMGQIDSIRHYEAPEILPNGDIILRRKPDAPPYVPPAAEPEAGEGAAPIDL